MFQFGDNSLRGSWLIGHRGAKGHSPENTFSSFECGLKMGAEILECDVHLSRDGKCIVIHDESVERTTNGHGLVRDLSSSQIKKLDAGTWFSKKFRGEKVPVLDELLRWVKKRKNNLGLPAGLVIEIKNEPIRYLDIEKKVIASVKKCGMEKRVILISFDHGAVKRAKKIDRQIPTGILYREPLEDPFRRAKELKADALFPRRHLVTRSLVRRAHQNGLFVGTWTVDNRAEMKKMIQTGVDAIASNYPDRLDRLLNHAPKR
ncbi:MAG: glycerophosphodiester phosphodiesterase [Elusimicrobia bacterium]|nr:glycerophosphodiester phosphodiesterase [Elusimicrobiota bacterium]